MSPFDRYKLLEAECERLVELLGEANLASGADGLTNPEVFRGHGEYGVWVEAVFEMLREKECRISGIVQEQFQRLGTMMEYPTNRFAKS